MGSMKAFEVTLYIYCLWIPQLVCALHNDTDGVFTLSDLIEDVFRGYDRRFPPKHDTPLVDGFEKQVDVAVEMYIISIFAISEVDMDYSMSVFLRQRWQDPRLSYNNTLNITRIVLDTTVFDKVWVPDMYILNEKQSDFHEVTVPNQYVHIYPDGTVQLSVRVTGKFFCSMLLHKFPFDLQECSFEVESYGHSTQSMQFRWTDTPLSIANDIEFPQFVLQKSRTYSCIKNYYGISYPCIGMRLSLQRSYNYYLIQLYVPSGLFVLLSWVNFWLDRHAVPARISLALLTVLTLTTQSEGARSNLPRVSYIKAIDVWMAMCLTFVFLALIEFAIVNVLTRTSDRRRGKLENESTNSSADSIPSISSRTKMVHNDDKPKSPLPFTPRLSFTPQTVDKVSRWLFPLIFVLFNIFYWLYYFYWTHEPDD